MFEGIIYKITGSCGKVYIGSTTNFNNRKSQHNCNNNNSSFSRKLLKPLQFEIIRTDTYKLIKTMLLVEQYYIDIYKCVNTQRAYQNRFTRRKYHKEYRKNWYKNNREDFLKKQNSKINCPYCNLLISKANIKKHQKTAKCLKLRTNINPLD